MLGLPFGWTGWQGSNSWTLGMQLDIPITLVHHEGDPAGKDTGSPDIRWSIVPGGGVALLRTRPAISKMELEGDQQIGVSIIRSAVEAPLRALASNAGLEGAVIVEAVLKSKGNSGFNVATEKYEDLVKAGVVDPKKVTRTALQNAGSIAGLLLTTECLITEIPEKEPPMPAGGGGHDHGMM